MSQYFQFFDYLKFLGLKMTLSLPVLDSGGQFLGVTALDVHLELTFYEVAHFHLGKDSYAFLVGDSGN